MEDSFRVGAYPQQVLDLRPENTYEQNIESLEHMIDNGYESIAEAYLDLDPRVFHHSFRDHYGQEKGPVKVDEEAIEQMQSILEENSQKNPSWINRKLFNIGYRNAHFSESLMDIGDKPYLPFGKDMVPDFDNSIFGNPHKEGKIKKNGDIYYHFASQELASDLADLNVETV